MAIVCPIKIPILKRGDKPGSYHLDDKLKARWDSLKNGKLAELDEDRIYIVDGREGSGKSLFTLQQASYIDPTVLTDLDSKGFPNRVCFSPEEVLAQIRKLRSDNKNTYCVIFDEAFRGLSSRSALSKVNKQIIQVLMEMREKNLVFFIVSPSFFLIDLYPAMIRSNALFHIAKKKGAKSRSFKVFSHKKKAKLYQHGIRKGWEYKVYTKFMGRFFGNYPGGNDFEKVYREKKRIAGIQNDAGKKEEVSNKFERQRDKIIAAKHKETGSLRKTAEFFTETWGEAVSHETIRRILSKLENPGTPGAIVTENQGI